MMLQKYEPTFEVEVKDEQGIVVAEVKKLLYVRKKDTTAAEASQQPRSGERIQPTA